MSMLNVSKEKFKSTIWGSEASIKFENVPFVCKIIDSSEGPLSVQVHPHHDRLAKDTHHRSPGKNEFWQVLSAEDGAKLYIGFKSIMSELSSFELKRLIKANVDLTEFMNVYFAEPGQLYIIPAGVIHCLGKGIKVFEMAQDCDVTYRLYDFNRDRGLDIEEGFESLSLRNYIPGCFLMP